VDLTCAESVVAGTPVVTVSGTVDMATVPVLGDALGRALRLHQGTVVAVDLDGVIALDDTGLGVLVGAAGRAREMGGDVAIVSTDGRLRDRLARCGLDRAVRVVGAVSELVAPAPAASPPAASAPAASAPPAG
jgi:anti-sigma B factor antagonist